MKSRLTSLIVAAVVVVLFTGQVRAASVNSIIKSIIKDSPEGTPTVIEDDSASISLVVLGGGSIGAATEGDIVVGIYNASFLTPATQTLGSTAILDPDGVFHLDNAAGSPKTSERMSLDSMDVSIEGVVVGELAFANGMDASAGFLLVHHDADVTIVDPSDAGNTITIPEFSADAILRVYVNNSMKTEGVSGNVVDDLDTHSNFDFSSHAAEFGVVTSDNFYSIRLAGSANPGFNFALDQIGDGNGELPQIEKAELSPGGAFADIAGQGDFTGTNNQWVVGDGNIAALFIPTPTASVLGLAMLGMIGMTQRRRNRTA